MVTICNNVNMPMQGQIKSPYNTALDILARRDNSEHEVRVKLAQKNISDHDINAVITKLHGNNLLDDYEYAGAYIRTILLTKPVGPRWLAHKLRGRGVDQSTIDRAIDEAYAGDQETQLANQAAAQWRKSHQKYSTDHPRLQRFLQARGFTNDATNQIIDNLPTT